MGQYLLVVCSLLFLFLCSGESKSCSKSSRLHQKTYRSTPFSLRPGDVYNRYNRMEFPSGHLGVKNFMAEVVDDWGTPVPLTEVYVHHWAVTQFHVLSSLAETFEFPGTYTSNDGSFAHVRGNDGLCQFAQFWGVGSETRHTNYTIPGSYATRVGDPAAIPEGYEPVWILNVHAIDTRETVDPRGCLECLCDLYSVTPSRSCYKGGFRCCYDGTRCKVRAGSQGRVRKLYLRYTIEWVEWDECVLPVRGFTFDVTDDGMNPGAGCKIEYDVPACENNAGISDCVHEKRSRLVIPRGGNLIYAAAHQHVGGQGMVLQREDGRHLCSSIPAYGQGSAAGDEGGYVVGMSSCYPDIGSVSLEDSETIQLTSYYNSSQEHTGVMALFYVLVADDGLSANT